MEQNQNTLGPEAATYEPASSSNLVRSIEGARPAADLLDFDPVPTRRRFDGLTPERQREFLEALADSGVARYAAARIGISEQAINRLRRRADARSFNLACDAAIRIGARRLQSIAYERAIEGTVRRYYYHGELKAEERVFDNKLLIYLLGKTEHLREPARESVAVAENWEPFMDALERGAPPPDLRPASERERNERLAAFEAEPDEADDDADGPDEEMVWEDENGVWWTRFPPPADFWGEEFGLPGEDDYRRFLTDAEQDAMEREQDEEAQERGETVLRLCARRDRYFGFKGGLDEGALPEDFDGKAEGDSEEGENSGLMEAETNETSGANPPEEEEAEIAESGGEVDKPAP